MRLRALYEKLKVEVQLFDTEDVGWPLRQLELDAPLTMDTDEDQGSLA